MADKKPEQFPKDEIINEKDRLVKGWISVEVKDSDGDIVPIAALRKTLNTWMKRGGFIIDTHSNKVIGKGLRWYEQEHPDAKEPGILLDYQIFDDYSIDDNAWEEIKNNKRTGLSFGGRAFGGSKITKDDYSGEYGMRLKALEGYEVSSVDDPANEFGKNVAVNYLAKSKKKYSKEEINDKAKQFNDLMKDFKKGYEGDITKPFMGFKNFGDCVREQRERGHSEDSADRICGWLQHRGEKGPGGHNPDGTGPHGRGAGPGKGQGKKKEVTTDNLIQTEKEEVDKISPVIIDTNKIEKISKNLDNIYDKLKIKNLNKKFDTILAKLNNNEKFK